MADLEEIIGAALQSVELGRGSLGNYRELVDFQKREFFLEDIENDAARELIGFVRHFNEIDKLIPIEDRKPITILINSYGGSINDCYAIIDTITFSKTPVHTKCIGVAYSAGGLILLAGHKREMTPMSSFMFHEGSAAMSGDAAKMKDQMRFYERQLEQMRQFVFKRTTISPELFKEKQERDWFLTAPEALEYGIVDKISNDWF